METPPSPLLSIARLLFWSAAIFALVMAILPQVAQLPGNPDDKLLHIIAFTILVLLAAFAYPRTRLLTLLVGLSAFGAIIEIIQMIPALNRTASLIDWAADTIAAAAVLGCIYLYRRFTRRASG